ncbi:MAG TPA: zinc-ribbon domain-containing protein [Candidatus Binatia bacterium]|jgi:predicted Zn finger-like uncharacterized protein
MLIQCPNCRTTYRLSDEVITSATPAFRCSRCKHTFELGSGDTPPTDPRVDAELKLPFAAKQGPRDLADDRKELDAPLNAEFERADTKRASDDRWAISDSSGADAPAFVIPDASRPEQQKLRDPPGDFPAEDPVFRKVEFDLAENPSNILAISPYLDQRASILPYVTLIILLVMGFSLFTVISRANPQTPEKILKTIPLIGSTVLKNNHLKEGILIQSLGTAHQSIQGNREVLAISGVALNQNPVVVREIQLIGKIYNQDGKEIERQTIWVGNTISPKIIRGMTLEDIPQLQELKPLKSFEIPPGDSLPFTIVFLKPINTAREFTCEVAIAEGNS